MVLALVRAHAILHAQHRERDDEGRVVATKEDYATVYNLVGERLAQGAGFAVTETIRETVRAVAELQKALPLGPPPTFAKIGKKLGIHKSNAQHRVEKCIELGYLVNQQTLRNQPAMIILGDPLPEDRPVLPHPDKL